MRKEIVLDGEASLQESGIVLYGTLDSDGNSRMPNMEFFLMRGGKPVTITAGYVFADSEGTATSRVFSTVTIVDGHVYASGLTGLKSVGQHKLYVCAEETGSTYYEYVSPYFTVDIRQYGSENDPANGE